MTTQTHRFRPLPSPALTTVLCGALALGLATAHARSPHAHKPASTPSTEQILAPSAATVPDALPPATQVWRCDDSYSAHPCADSAGKPLAVTDARSEAQRRQSDDVTAREKRLAAWYEAGRRQRELVASAPAGTQAVAPAPTCVDTTMMHCVPKKPRTRRLTSRAASSPALAGKARK